MRYIHDKKAGRTETRSHMGKKNATLAKLEASRVVAVLRGGDGWD